MGRVRLQRAWQVAQGHQVATTTAPLNRPWFDAIAEEPWTAHLLSDDVNDTRREARLSRKYGSGWE